MHHESTPPPAPASDKEGYTAADKATCPSLMPFILAFAIALVAGLAAMVLWLSWDGAPREPGQMTATEAGPSRVPPASDAGEGSDGSL